MDRHGIPYNRRTMKRVSPTNRRPSFSILMIGVLAVLLPLLAVLQYRWIGQISMDEGERMRDTLDFATTRSARDVFDELQEIVTAFRLRQVPFAFAELLAEDYENWQATANNPMLLRNVYLYDGPERTYRRFDPVTGDLVEDVPPVAGLEWWFNNPGNDPVPGDALAARGLEHDQIWIASAVFPGRQQRSGPNSRSPEYWTLFEVNSEFLWSELIPSIVETRFEQTDYRVGIQNTRTGQLLYASDDSVSASLVEDADVIQPLAHGWQRPFRTIGPGLRLAAQHELGSLAEAVASARRRNLAVGFGILALLGVSGAMIIVWSERVRSVGRLQMEFAAGISHELRTPLATIRTAAHNIAAGIVKSPEEIREYAEIVQSEGRRLSAMVDQSIQFAQTEAGRRHYDLRPVEVDEVIRRAVRTALPAAEEGGNRIEIRRPDDTPQALADETALTHCLVNLLTNAAKFGPSDRPVAVEARHDRKAGRILLSVHNEGPGIDVDELPNLFEPFYRGSGTSHVPGSGLGLSLVRRMMAGQKGDVTVDSKPGQGATFVLHIPAAPETGASGNS